MGNRLGNRQTPIPIERQAAPNDGKSNYSNHAYKSSLGLLALGCCRFKAASFLGPDGVKPLLAHHVQDAIRYDWRCAHLPPHLIGANQDLLFAVSEYMHFFAIRSKENLPVHPIRRAPNWSFEVVC